ncbi:COG4223 family protein [Caulobacter mirabilis]|uniref:Inner membrane protein n=1 Tax=Caulobacter mirabilis TaxID=69666 RepID=A0A2D2ASN4_9CAUL|nr:hypothetical protein [Caulobacter mirabilis]ATQ41001.1 hypothetical protein CSW64_00565 [Caulobacter mirabilis]
MTTAPDPAEITPPTDPAAYGRRRGKPGFAFWAGVVGAVVCVGAGFALAQYLPRLRVDPSSPPPVEAPAMPAAPVETAPAQTFVPAIPAEPVAPPSVDITALEDRIAALEAGQNRAVNAAAAALAAATLADAAERSGPFQPELAALSRLLPTSAEVRALTPYADTGAPSRTTLAGEYDAAAAQAAVAARDPGKRGAVLDQMIHALSSIVTIRRVGDTAGDSPDALLARAGQSVAEGDVEGALKTLRGLPPKAAQAMRPWTTRAQQRVAVDRQVAAIRAVALSDLMASAREPS